MRRILAIVLAAAMMLGMSACGAEKSAVTETTIEARKNGTIVHTIVEEFTEEYYSFDELMEMITDSCTNYNASAGKGRVVVESVELSEGILTAVMKYKSADDYTAFNQVPLFTGTIQEAIDAGYNMNVRLYLADGGEFTIGKEELLEMKDRHLMILREEVFVRVWNDILYHSMNVMETSDPDRVLVLNDNTLTFLVFD